jgi:ABC-type glycerol-3-phosphate transport system substrate-binding protein
MLARALITVLLAPLLAACLAQTPPASEAPNAIDQLDLKGPIALTLWHTQTGANATALQAMVDDFNRTNAYGITVKLEYQGTYTQLYANTIAAINAGAPPELAVAYESFVADYMRAVPSPLVELDPYVNSGKYGLTKASLDDIFKADLDTNRFAQFGDKLLSFPFTKSLLVMYQNDDILKELGMPSPKTWGDFERVASAAKKVAADGKTVARYGWAVVSNDSTFNGWVLSRGGHLVSDDGKTVRWDAAEGLASLQLVDQCIKQRWCYAPRGFDYLNDFAAGRVAFVMEASNGRASFRAAMKDPKPNWSIVPIPQKDPANLRTVLYGANITAFKSTAEKQLASWLFIKWFADTAQTAKWSLASSYLPIRKSAANDAALKASWSSSDVQGKQAFDQSAASQPEPNVRGQQDVRSVVEDAITAILTQKDTPEHVIQTAAARANQILKDNQ